MSGEQVKALFKRIKAHYDKFSSNQTKLDEWVKILSDYKCDGVNYNFDKYLRENREEPPKAVDLINEFIKETKTLSGVKCQICNKNIKRDLFEQHYDRCSSIDYIVRNRKKYFGEDTSKEALWKLSDEEFESRYWKFCEKLYECKDLSDLEKRGLQNAILTHYGHEPEWGIEDLLSQIGR